MSPQETIKNSNLRHIGREVKENWGSLVRQEIYSVSRVGIMRFYANEALFAFIGHEIPLHNRVEWKCFKRGTGEQVWKRTKSELQ